MTRYEFEAYEAARRNKSVADMGELGYYSARCLCQIEDCPGWQAIAIPTGTIEEERRRMLSDLRTLAPKPFGGVQ